MISPRLFRSNDFPFMAVQRERAKNFRSCVHVWRSVPLLAREMSLCSEKRVRVISRYAGTSFFSQALTCTSFYPRHLSRLRHLWQIRIGSAKYIYHTSFRREFLFLEQPFSLVPITRYFVGREKKRAASGLRVIFSYYILYYIF